MASLSLVSSTSLSSSIQVVVRLRPMNEKEKTHGTLPVITASTQERTVTVIKGQGSRQVRSSFTFDNVFTAFSSQEEVFEETLKPVIGDVMRGYESTVFAYGQTGTGKTHTMEGDLASPEMHGVIPRSAQAIFEALKKPEYHSHTVTCSYLEIYNEDLSDLLADDAKGADHKKVPTKLEIMEGKTGTFCRGLTEKEVSSAEDVLSLMQRAQNQRKIGETKMNKHSSRSHCIFTIRIQAKKTFQDGNTLEFNGKLHMVDLAGSECAKTACLDKASGSEAARERERMNINRSLLTLGRVISMLKVQCENKKTGNVHIPYRDSKLTRILQESLGGRCKTLIVATLSPSITAIEESISTLNYAQSANGIINKPVATSYMSTTPNCFIGSTSIIANDAASGDSGNTVEHWHEMECRLQYMQAQVEEAQAALARKHMQQLELAERAEKAEADRLELEKKNFEANQQINALILDIASEREQNEVLSSQLRQTEIFLKKTTAILDATKRTEVCLTSEATDLLTTLKKSISDGDNMHRIIVEGRDADVQRRKAANTFHFATVKLLDDALTALTALSVKESEYLKSVTNVATESHERGEKALSESAILVKDICSTVVNLSLTMKAQVMDENGIMSLLKVTTSKIKEKVNDAQSIILDGDKSFVATCKEARAQLTEYALHLANLEAAFMAKSKETVTALENNISASKENLYRMVGSTTEALRATKVSRTNARNAFDGLLSQWNSCVMQASSNVGEKTKAHHFAVSKELHFFVAEMRRHEEMTSSLDEQRSFVLDKGRAQLGEVASQASVLVAQREAFVEAQEKQKLMRAEFMAKVMSGIQILMMQHFETLSVQQEDDFQLLDKSNKSLVDTNYRIAELGQSLVSQVSTTNTTLTEQVQAVRNNDVGVIKVLERTNEILDDITNISNVQQRSANNFAKGAGEYMTSLQNSDNATDEVVERIQSYKGSCSDHLIGSVLRTGLEGISSLTDSGQGIAKFGTTTVLDNASASLHSLEKPRDQVSRDLSNSLDKIFDIMASGRVNIDNICTKQCTMTDTLSKKVQSCKQTYTNDILRSHRTDLESIRDNVIKAANSHATEASTTLSAASTQASIAKSNLRDFTSNVIRSEEDVSPILVRDLPSFSEKLTSTPAADVIVQGLELRIAEFDASRRENEAFNDENYAPNEQTARYNEANDGMSLKSEGSGGSVSSPVLKERNLNCDQPDGNGLAKTFAFNSSKKKRPNSDSAAKRSNSRTRPASNTPIAVRKKPRVMSTPPTVSRCSSIGSKRGFK